MEDNLRLLRLLLNLPPIHPRRRGSERLVCKSTCSADPGVFNIILFSLLFLSIAHFSSVSSHFQLNSHPLHSVNSSSSRRRLGRFCPHLSCWSLPSFQLKPIPQMASYGAASIMIRRPVTRRWNIQKLLQRSMNLSMTMLAKNTNYRSKINSLPSILSRSYVPIADFNLSQFGKSTRCKFFH